MMKLLAIIAIPFILVGCASTSPNLIRTENRVVRVPEQFIAACPDLPKLPRVSTLTDIQVAELIKKLYRNNAACAEAMKQIKSYDSQATNLIESK